jgi:hypothetical protein
VYNEEQRPILGKPNRRVPLFLIGTRIFDANKWVEEDLACHLKTHAMLSDIDGRLL